MRGVSKSSGFQGQSHCPLDASESVVWGWDAQIWYPSHREQLFARSIVLSSSWLVPEYLHIDTFPSKERGDIAGKRGAVSFLHIFPQRTQPPTRNVILTNIVATTKAAKKCTQEFSIIPRRSTYTIKCFIIKMLLKL